MNYTDITDNSLEELISIPSFLSNNSDYGISLAACYNNQTGDCGVCQYNTQSCSATQHGSCGLCEADQGLVPCNESCSAMCAGEAGDACGECSSMSGCMGQGGPCGQSSCGQPCSECGSCENCMDCENSCQNSVQLSIDLWDWFANNDTKAAYNAIMNNGLVSEFDFSVWNDLVDRVYDLLDLLGESWNGEYASYYDTRMSSVSKTLTATRFNSLRYQIGTHVSTEITERVTGDTVYGHYFITLTDCLNEWISSS